MPPELQAQLSEQERLLQELSQREPELAAALRENALRVLDLHNLSKEQHQSFLSRMLLSITEHKLILCHDQSDLPQPLDMVTDVTDREADGSSPAVIPLLPTTLRTARQQASKVAAACSLSWERQHDQLTAVGEATINAVMHPTSGSSTARLLGNTQEQKVQVWIENEGMDIKSALRGRKTMEDDFTSWYTGFATMLNTCDTVYVLTGVEGTTVVLEVQNSTADTVFRQRN
jgi:anti-sigma regulatory factor (Ser/Thr protein kinase)